MNKLKLAPIAVLLCFCLLVSWYLGLTNPWDDSSKSPELREIKKNDDVVLYKFTELDAAIQKFSVVYKGQSIVFYQKKSNSLRDLLGNVSRQLGKRKRKKEVRVAFLNGSSKVNLNLSTEICFKPGNTLKINHKRYSILFNPSDIVHGTLPDLVLPGFSIFPTILFKKHEKGWYYEWYKSRHKGSNWKLVGKGFTYTPVASDVGHYLKCILYGNYMNKLEMVTWRTVSSVPHSVYYFDERHKETEVRSPAAELFRFVTYNILADVNVQENPYLLSNINKTVLDINYRRLVLMKEMKGYKADVISLQECELNLFEDYLVPFFNYLGYEGFITLKTGRKLEGEAMFYRKEKFIHVKDLSISVANAMKKDCNNRFYRKLNKHVPHLLRKAAKTYIGQIHLFKMKTHQQKSVCVLNTHLYWKEKGYLLRFIQMVFLLNYMNSAVKDASIIVTGDLNSVKGQDIVLDYLAGSPVTFCLSSQKTPLFTTKPDGVCVRNITTLKSPVSFTYLSGGLKFTYYKNFQGGVYDHVYGSSKLVTHRNIPMMKWESVHKYKNLVGPMYPSDHSALVLDIDWT